MPRKSATDVMFAMMEKYRSEGAPCVSCDSSEQVEGSLERWRYELERRTMKVTRSKTEGTQFEQFGDNVREERLRRFEHV